MNLRCRANSPSPVYLSGLLLVATACCAAPPPPTPQGCGGPAATPTATTAGPVEERRVEDFENASGLSGGLWYEFDKNSLGTVANPNPFTLAPGGAPKSPGYAAHVWGTLGADRAPWTWVQLQVFLNRNKAADDLTKYASLSFYVKGDGGRYNVALVRDSVTDYDHYHYEFTAPKAWTEIKVPLDAFRQYGWGKHVSAQHKDVKFIQLSPAAHSQPFDVWFDDIALSTDKATQKPFVYDTKGWFPYTGFAPQQRRGTALDMSRWLDAPAGKHGPLGKRGEDFVFKDGKVARFIGVNIVASANFPSHEEADKIAELLSQLGVNLTRHHHMDAAWSSPNLFGNKPSTLEIDAAAMERFDYLVSQLQKRGIYQYFDMLVHRKLSAADGVPAADKLAAGLKVEGEFDPKLIELQERFITQFMGHLNSHTARTYAKDPAVVMLEAINEDSLFWLMPEGEFSVKTPEGRATFARQFSAWLTRLGVKDRAALEKRWAGVGRGLAPREDPKQGNVDAFVATGRGKEKELTPNRAKDTLQFYYDTTLAYFRRIEKLLRGLGYQGQFTGSNHWTEHPLDLRVNSELDFVDRHAYWSHPNGGWGYKPEVTWDNSPMVKDPELGIVGQLARRRVKGLPYSTSEWQTSAPNDYRHEGLLLVGAYAALQGFSPIQFALSHDLSKRVDAISSLSNNFDILDQPTALGGWPAVAALFHRGDVRSAELEGYLRYEKDNGFAPGANFDYPPKLGLIARTGVAFDAGQSKSELDAIRTKYQKGSRVSSSTGELHHDAAAGRFEIDTPRTQGTISFATEQAIQLSSTKFEQKSPFGVIVVTALDDQPIAASKHLLVTALGNAINSGMSLSSNRSGFVDVGHSPILVEPIVGRVTIATQQAGTAHCFPLEVSGARKQEILLTQQAGSVALELAAVHQTMHYEIVR